MNAAHKKVAGAIILISVLLSLSTYVSFAGIFITQKVVPSHGVILTKKMLVGVDYWANFTASHLKSRDLPFMIECGVKVVRLEFNPAYEANFKETVSIFVANGIKIVAVLMRRDLVDDINAWGEWVYETVNKYKHMVKVWEIWNEPNWDTGFGAPGDPLKYMEFLKVAYVKAKQADPNCTVLGGSVLGTDNAGLNFLRAMYENGAKDYMDALAYHPYCTIVSPLYPHQTSTGKAFWKLEWVRNIMTEYGDGNKKIWITEVGWATNGTNAVSEDQQALFLTQALELAGTWNWVEAFIIYNWMDGGGFYFGLMRTRYNPPYTYENFCKMSYFAVKDFIRQFYQ